MVLSPAHPHEKRVAFRLVVCAVFGKEREVSGIRPAWSNPAHISRRERFGKNTFHPDSIMDLRINIRSIFPHALTLPPVRATFISREHGIIADFPNITSRLRRQNAHVIICDLALLFVSRSIANALFRIVKYAYPVTMEKFMKAKILFFGMAIAALTSFGAMAQSNDSITQNQTKLPTPYKTASLLIAPGQSGQCYYTSGSDCTKQCDMGMCVKCKNGYYACTKFDPPPRKK